MSASSASDVEATVTPALGAWVAGLSFAAIPPRVVAMLKRCLLDGIGCALYGGRQQWGRIAADVAIAQSGPDGACALIGRPQRVSPADAALVNGLSLHGYEIDDIHVASSLHPGAVCIPAVLAIADLRHLTGVQILTALAAGYEVGIRLGICAGVRHSTSGFHVTGTVGAVAAAAAAARALDLDATRATHAIALGATQAGGLYAARLGAMAKRFHAGRAAQSGVIAALLAERGFTGSEIAIEAPFGGFLSALSGQHAAETMLEGLGQAWETEKVGFKAYAACASAHTTIDAVLAMRAEGLTPENLRKLRIGMSRKGATNVGWAYKPAEVVSAQMNGSYAAAVALLDGAAFVDQYSPERIADPRILDLITRVEITHDETLDAGGAAKRHAVRAVAELRNGCRMERYVEQRTGSAEHPLTDEQIERKFRTIAADVLSKSVASNVIATVGSLERLDDVRALTGLLH